MRVNSCMMCSVASVLLAFGGCQQSSPPAQTAVAEPVPVQDVSKLIKEIETYAKTSAAASRPNPVAEQAFADLMAASENSDLEAWATAEQKLTELGAASVPTLAAHLSDENPFARELAVQYLAQLGPDAAAAENELAAALSDSSPMVRVNAASSLLAMNVQTESAEAVLKELVANADPTIRLPAAISLAGFDPDSTQARSALIELLTTNDEPVRLAAVQSLGRMGEKAKSGLNAVRELEADDSPQIRAAALKAARQIEGGTDETSDTVPVGGIEQ